MFKNDLEAFGKKRFASGFLFAVGLIAFGFFIFALTKKPFLIGQTPTYVLLPAAIVVCCLLCYRFEGSAKMNQESISRFLSGEQSSDGS